MLSLGYSRKPDCLDVKDHRVDPMDDMYVQTSVSHLSIHVNGCAYTPSSFVQKATKEIRYLKLEAHSQHPGIGVLTTIPMHLSVYLYLSIYFNLSVHIYIYLDLYQ